MTRLFLTVCSISSGHLVALSGAGPESALEFVTSDQLPSGTYRAVEQNGTICQQLPRLVGFEMVVTAGVDRQLATFNAEVLSSESPVHRYPIDGAEKGALVWYDFDYVRWMKQFGSLQVRETPNCFHVYPYSKVHHFMFTLLFRLRIMRFSPKKSSQLIFCRTELGIIVGIGKQIPKERRKLESTTYGFRIALCETCSGDKADDVPEKSKKRSSLILAGGNPPKLARREEVSGASDDSSDRSSDKSPVSAWLTCGDDETGTGSSTSGMGSHSQADVVFRGEAATEERGEDETAIIPDGEYETVDTGLENVRKITVDIRSDTEAHQSWVKLRVEFGAYVWPVYFPEVTADFHEECLFINYSHEEDSADLALLETCLQSHHGSVKNLRICRDTGGGWSLRFDRIGSSDGTDVGSPVPSTIHIKLYAVLCS